MYFSSLLFLFLYLPVVLGIYYITPRRYRNLFLLIANLVFYGWGEPRLIWVMGVSMLTNYGFGWLIQRYRHHEKLARLYLVLSVVVSLGILGYFKYADFMLGLLRWIPSFSSLPALQMPLPIGISFYTFQTMSYTIDVYRGDTAAQKNFVTFGTYVSFFPQLIAGPIVRYRDIEQQLQNRREGIEQFADGVRLMLAGLAKKVLIANQMGLFWDALRTVQGEGGLVAAWMGILAYTLQIYFDFSGYSDMACGLGKMFGFEFIKNFDYPYIAKSITEFWRRWHISLSTWFRDYVYIPLGGSRKGRGRTMLNLLVVWALTGLWHGASLNFLLWGLYYFVLLALEKLFLTQWMEKWPAWMRHIYTMALVMLGWTLFYFEDFAQLKRYLATMFSLSSGWVSPQAGHIVLSYLPLMAVAVVACLPAGRNLWIRVRQRRKIWVVELVMCAAAMLLCTASLVSQNYNPFLYFRF